MKSIIFENKHILISGGSSGIGLALAKQFCQLGSHVTILARNRPKLESARKELEFFQIKDSQCIEIISADVSDFQLLAKSLQSIEIPVDILVNSAGIAYPGEFYNLDQEIYQRVMDINYLGTVNLTKLLVPAMIDQRNGYVVNISSLAAVIGIYGYTAYAPSKYAVRGFSRCLRAELVPKGINVSIVLPPDTDTPQLEFERSLLPEITKKINQNGGVLSAEKVAREIIRGMKKGIFTIIPGIEGKILYALAPVFGRYFYRFALRQQKK